MKYNQFAYQKTSQQQMLRELAAINFLPVNWQQLSLAQLLADFVGKVIVEAQTPAAKAAKLQELAVNDQQTLASWLQTDAQQLSQKEFANLALALLGYHVGYDFQLQEPLSYLKKHALPLFAAANRQNLPQLFYRLLNTRSRNGQTLIDVMAGKGYFRQFYGKDRYLFFNGKSQPVFDMSKVIREVVYVASDLDTDQDGENDLLQVSVFRPSESKQLTMPALYTADPYFGGIIENEQRNHSVDLNLSDATNWQNPQYQALPHLPAAKSTGQTAQTTETAVHKAPYSLNEYMLARGYATVYAGAIGTRGSDGLRVTGAPEETEAAKAVIEWLHGDRIAYTDRSRQQEVRANWCNGQIGMTGRSYLGTLQIALATTGVAGLKTVVSEAAISSWYDYYREHGLVVAPEACQGEDLDMLAETCQSNLWNSGSYLKIKPKFDQMQTQLRKKEDRASGQYSDFWEARNYRHHTDNIKCSWISVHGLNDWNVKPKNVYKLWQKVKKLPLQAHLFLHQGPHYNMNNLVSIDYTDLLSLWFAHELLSVDNNAYQQWPRVLVQDNLQADYWHHEEDWANSIGQKVSYYPANGNSLAKDGQERGIAKFTDRGGQDFRQAKISEGQWQQEFINGQAPWNQACLRLTSDEFIHPVTIVGRPHFETKVAVDQKVGQLSVALVEVAKRKRLTATPQAIFGQEQELGYRFGSEELKEFKPDKVSQAKLITKAHMNLQNYQDFKKPLPIEPGHFYQLSFDLQPTYYTLPAGSKLLLIIYSTDQAMTKRPLISENYQIDLGQTVLSFSEK
jgi:X-Pro dipeptidyl-peptidase